jgi:putative selenate reductase
MSKLTPVPLEVLLRRMRREAEACGAIFDLPARKWFHPPAGYDFRARPISGVAGTPAGPAAGPHTQMAQNLVLAWLAGGRFLELKTVQVNDRLEIPRPCIRIPNVGYNVEWSQELRVEESLEEYAKAVFLIEVLKQSRAWGAASDGADFAAGGETIYDISVGYDLAGIRSEKVTGFLWAMQKPAKLFAALRRQVPEELREWRDVALPEAISDSVTLSTFHGCPAKEIEAITRYLLEEVGLHVVIKFNPTLLGYEPVRELLHERLGYRHLRLMREAFENDLQFEDAIEMMHRLRRVAANCGRRVGGKFTNTLVVANEPSLFPTQPDPYMYLSGQPLHVLAMNLMLRFREAAGFDLPISFSAGIDRRNFPAAVACGMAPVTTCTDLLRQGGYGRLPAYLERLREAMEQRRVRTLSAYVLAAQGEGAAAVEAAICECPGGAQAWEQAGGRLTRIALEQPDELPRAVLETARENGWDADELLTRAVAIAGLRNARKIVPALERESRYHAAANRQEPRKIASVLALYDCINCDLCIAACPNDAIFAYRAEPMDVPTSVLRLAADGRIESAPGRGFRIGKQHQLAVVRDLCNECSNCETYCPEQGAPFGVKEQVYHCSGSLLETPEAEGFWRSGSTLCGRVDGKELRFTVEWERNRAAVSGEDFELELQWEPFAVLGGRARGRAEATLDTAVLWRMRTVWQSVFHSPQPNMVNPEPAADARRGAPAAKTEKR